MFLITALLSGCGDDTSYGSVYGTIVDMSGNPIEGATVKIGDKETTTNTSGNFKITDLSTGNKTITAEKYKTSIDSKLENDKYYFFNKSSRKINISKGSNTIDDLALNPRFIISDLKIYFDTWDDLSVTGKIENNKSETVDYVEIQIKLYDSEGVRLEKNYTNLTELNEEEVAEWEIYTLYDGTESKIDSYELDVEYSIYDD